MRNIHPTETGGGGEKLRSIDERQKGDPSEAQIVRCYQCGFINDLSKIQTGNTSTHSESLIRMGNHGGSVSLGDNDPSIEFGCRFCQSPNPLGRRREEFKVKKAPRSYRG